MAGVGGSKGGKWRQLYLNNNKKCEKKKVNFIWRFKSFILSQHLIYFKIISLEGIQCGLICIKKWQLCFFFFYGSIGSLNQLKFFFFFYCYSITVVCLYSVMFLKLSLYCFKFVECVIAVYVFVYKYCILIVNV